MRFANLTLAALFVVASSTVQAQIATFDLSYSGASFGNTAVATGSITIDESLVNNPGNTDQTGEFYPPASPFITAFSLTISGASSGNGTFTLPDFSTIFLNTGPGTVDFSQELVGQANFQDFNVFNRDPLTNLPTGTPAPDGVFPLAFGTNDNSGDILVLTSFRPAAAVPEPGSIALLAGMGISGAGFLARRRKNARQAA